MRTVELINKPMSLYDVAAFNEDGDECMGLEWMRALRGIKLKRPADELFESFSESYVIHTLDPHQCRMQMLRY